MLSSVVIIIALLQLLSALASIPIRCMPRSHSPTANNVLTTLVNRNELSAYLVPVSIGGQEFSVILDTGSSDLWVASSECATSDCNGTTKYIMNKSPSLSLSDKEFRLSYLMGSVLGNVAFENIRLGPFEIVSQVFALANTTQGLGLSSTGTSGILGLSFASTASISLAVGSTLLANILSNFDEPNQFFAFRLGRGSGLNDSTSSFTIGELDENITSDMSSFAFMPVSRAGAESFDYWKLPLQSLVIGDTTLTLSSSLVPGSTAQVAVLDTGTTLILGPTRDVETFWNVVDWEDATRKNEASGLWEVRCDRGMSVSFLLGEKGDQKAFPIHPGDINWGDSSSGNGWCLGGIQANDGVNSGDWLLGGVFLRNVYVIHHLANSTHQPLIGLLNMTDPVASMAQFRRNRGPEQSYSTSHHSRPNTHTTSPSTAVIYVISSLCGFVVGGAVTLFVKIRSRHSSWY